MSETVKRPLITVEKPKLLIVEGKDDEFIFKALVKKLALADVQILPVGGKTLIKENLAALVLDPGFPRVNALAILRDADFPEDTVVAGTAASIAFRSVCDALAHNGLPVPTTHGVFASGSPRTVVFILPDGESDGMLEDLCLASFTSDPAHECVNRYFTCLAAAGITHAENRIAKARMHALLASRREPDLQLGMAATRGYLDFSGPAFAPVVDLLSKL